ncbi:hypothetical protein PPACK8108_LOCUS25927 [Phakopsora pachyrhizi]|uniref:DNA 3'-5' helicase n=1 Tax=Phakopsora pachyrhizi TaxID=170000 RepID=A0AAV0BSV8_PHAPC|nr:hypothetical protein PPACK8108_LOCUS25927 [Phakopsora pachyrhizi]
MAARKRNGLEDEIADRTKRLRTAESQNAEGIASDDEADENLDAAFVSDGESADELSRPRRRVNANPVEPQAMRLDRDNGDPSNSFPSDMISSQSAGDFVSTDFSSGCDYRYLNLKADHSSRPLYISPNMATRTIILEAFHPLASQAQDFLITIAEPVSRPTHIHEYKLTKHSLQAAISVGLQTEDIIDVSQSIHPRVYCKLWEGQAGGTMMTFGFNQDIAPKKAEGSTQGTSVATGDNTKPADDELFGAIIGVDNGHGAEIENVKRRCAELDYPMLEEYDFRNDTVNPTLEIDLKPATQIRPLSRKEPERARSGIIVLPCGAGKTLVGITAASTIRKSVLCLCTSGVSVMQWRQQFLMWSNIQDRQISVFTAEQKEKFAGASGIVVSTYSMVANRTKRSHDSQKMMDFFDVHVVPAAMFRRVVGTIKAHAKLGLTATLVREDDKIDDLNFLIGPKLYEANWMDLAAKGHIANVQCAEVWCPMTPEFYREYLREKSRKRNLLYCMNPQKFQACQFSYQAYAKKLRKLYIHGGTPQVERMRILQNFQHNPLVNTIFSTCLIQISSHFGSRRQEAQRLGRILRAKRRNDEGFNAFFYSLVSRDTQEFYFSTKRQQFLIDQGYAFKVISHLQGLESLPELVYATKEEQIELLQSVLLANESAEIGTDVKNFGDELKGPSAANKRIGAPAPGVKRVVGNLVALSGGQSMSYVERNKSANKQLSKESLKSRNKLFSKRDEAAKKKKKERESGSMA